MTKMVSVAACCKSFAICALHCFFQSDPASAVVAEGCDIGTCADVGSSNPQVILIQKPDETRTLQVSRASAVQTDQNKFSVDINGELAYLAAGMSWHGNEVTDAYLSSMGWTVGTAIVDTTNASQNMLDTAQVYKKVDSATSTTECALVFSATDDAIDTVQQMMGAMSPVHFCGAEGVNGGYAQEMLGYMQSTNWPAAMTELSSECTAVTAVGHSMGGAMASLFAFCANNDARTSGALNSTLQDAFGTIGNVSLVTFGAPGPAKTPLYSGQAGGCFQGARKYVSATPTGPGMEFHVANLNLFGGFMTAMGLEDEATSLLTLSGALSSGDMPYSDATTSVALNNAAGWNGIGAMWLLAYAIMQNEILPGYEHLLPTYPALQAQIQAFLSASAMNLIYSYDPVPQLFASFDYVHPLISAEPQARQGTEGLTVASATTCGAAGTTQPNEDYAQLFWGLILANAGSSHLTFPNHGMCCLIPDANCPKKFEGNFGTTCPASMFR